MSIYFHCSVHCGAPWIDPRSSDIKKGASTTVECRGGDCDWLWFCGTAFVGVKCSFAHWADGLTLCLLIISRERICGWTVDEIASLLKNVFNILDYLLLLKWELGTK